MLSTKNIVETARLAKTLAPGKHLVKINGITLGKGYKANSYNVYLNVEGPDQGPDFEGFLMDYNDKEGPRYTGQIGRVRLSPFAFEDGVTKSGIKVNRYLSILRGLKNLSKALDLEDQIDLIESDTIEEFVQQANTILSGEKFINMILAGKTYEKGGYTQYDLFIPTSKEGKYGYESADVKPEDSKLMTFNSDVHIIHKAAIPAVESFEPVTQDESFNL